MSDLGALTKSEIKFPSPINKRLFESLLYMIATKLESNISYKLELTQSINHRDSKSGTPRHTYDSIKYSGMISSKKTFASASFETASGLDYLEKVSSIKFQTIPGYSLSEHRPEEVEIWDKTRKVVESYFSAKKDFSISENDR